jgi:hypothetical protein
MLLSQRYTERVRWNTEVSDIQIIAKESLLGLGFIVTVPNVVVIIRAIMMEAARTSETSVDNHFTQQYIPEDKSELNTCFD